MCTCLVGAGESKSGAIHLDTIGRGGRDSNIIDEPLHGTDASDVLILITQQCSEVFSMRTVELQRLTSLTGDTRGRTESHLYSDVETRVTTRTLAMTTYTLSLNTY